MMDQKLKTKWLEALRSGKYKQCQGTLYNGNGAHCCLGVLCVLNKDTSASLDSMVGNDDGRTRDSISLLIKMNDVENKSFPEIADWIEENL